MGRLGQTIGRIGAGFTAMGAVAWLLWPDHLSKLSNPEAWFVLLTSIGFWLFTEINEPASADLPSASGNDIRLARTLMEMHSNRLRALLFERDLWSFLPAQWYNSLGDLVDRRARGVLFFHNGEFDNQLDTFCLQIEELNDYVSQFSGYETINGVGHIGFKPFSIVPQGRYEELQSHAAEANKKASTAWKTLDKLVDELKYRLPEATEEALE